MRTKDNIARVRKDEAAAKAEDLKRQQQVDFAVDMKIFSTFRLFITFNKNFISRKVKHV